MRHTIGTVLAGLLATGCADDSLTLPQLSEAPPMPGAFSYTTIDVPGAMATQPQGINRQGDVVGIFRDAKGVHGFLLRNGTFTTIDYPGAAITEARDINRDGTIIGTYRLPGEPAVNVHGFRRTPQGEFAAADYPGHTNTIPQRILEDGTILGCRHDHDFMETMRGVVMGPNGNSEIDVFASMHNGGTPNLRRIVGLYTNSDANRTEGYVIDDGEFKPLLVPGSRATAAWDVNPAGEVVGLYQNDSGVHGFVLRADGYVSVDVPGATATRAFGINRSGDVVGFFADPDGRVRGFLAKRTG